MTPRFNWSEFPYVPRKKPRNFLRQKVQAKKLKSKPKTTSVPSSSATAVTAKNHSTRVLHNPNSVANIQRQLYPIAFDPTIKKLTSWNLIDWERVRHTDWSRCQQAQRWTCSVNTFRRSKALDCAFVRPSSGYCTLADLDVLLKNRVLRKNNWGFFNVGVSHLSISIAN